MNIFWEDTSLNSYMCRFVSASNPRVASANAKIEEGIADEPVYPLLLSKISVHCMLFLARALLQTTMALLPTCHNFRYDR